MTRLAPLHQGCPSPNAHLGRGQAEIDVDREGRGPRWGTTDRRAALEQH
jgi:hypothetical protein